MGRYSDNQFFQGDIDNTNIRDFFKMDMEKKSTKERMKSINDSLESNEYFLDYFSDHFKVNINAGDALSEDVNVCQTLEKMANYILNSEDEIEIRRKEKPIYVFHTSKDKLEGKMNRETISVRSDSGLVSNMVDNDNIVHAILASSSNSRLPKTQTIKPIDLKADTECGRILREYQVFLDHVDSKLKGIPGRHWRSYSNAKGQVKDDMINVKNMLTGVWGFNTKISESTKPDLDIFDFTDFNTIKYMLSVKKPSLMQDYDGWILWNDFNDTVKKANFTNEENAIHHLLQLQYSMVDISEELDIKEYRLRRTLMNNMIKKISKVGNKYDCSDDKIAEKVKKRKLEAKEDANV